MADSEDPHDWYFVVKCEKCGEFISLGVAPPIDAPVEPKFRELRVICPACGGDGSYRQDQLSRQLQRVRPSAESARPA